MVRKIGDVDVLKLRPLSYPSEKNIADFLENKEILNDRNHLTWDVKEDKKHKHFVGFDIENTNISVYIMDPKG